MADYDLAIIGGGLNGVQRGARRRGTRLRAILLEQGDSAPPRPGLAAADPRRSGGAGARAVFCAFVRRWPSATSGCGPRRICASGALCHPAHSDERPSWLLRSGFAALRPAGPRSDLPASATVDVTHHPVATR